MGAVGSKVEQAANWVSKKGEEGAKWLLQPHGITGTNAETKKLTEAQVAAPDLFDASAIAARQRAARRMSDGMRSTFQTSSRGTEAAAGTGLTAPQEDAPLITTMDGVDSAQYQAALQKSRQRSPGGLLPGTVGIPAGETGRPSIRLRVR